MAMQMETDRCGGCGEEAPAATFSMTDEGTRCATCFAGWERTQRHNTIGKTARLGYAIATLPLWLRFDLGLYRLVPLLAGLATVGLMVAWFAPRVKKDGLKIRLSHEGLLLAAGLCEFVYGFLPALLPR